MVVRMHAPAPIRVRPGILPDPIRPPPLNPQSTMAIVTLLHIASLIPAGKPRIIPGELPCFSELLPLQKGGVRQKWYNRALYGPGIVTPEDPEKGGLRGGGCLPLPGSDPGKIGNRPSRFDPFPLAVDLHEG